MEKSKLEIIAGSKENIEDFNILVDMYTPLAAGWLRNMANNMEDIKDIMQESFIKLYRDIPQLNEIDKFDGWFKRLVINTCSDWYRRRSNKIKPIEIDESIVSIEDIGSNPHNIVENNELSEMLKQAINKLSENNRVIFKLFYDYDKKCSDIAKMLGMSETAVKSRLSRSREQLRKDLSVLTPAACSYRIFKILVLCCSHKGGGTSKEVGDRVLQSISKASPSSMVKVIELSDYELKGCRVCNQCLTHNRCTINDGFNEIFNHLLESDAVVVVSPYYAPIPSKLSALLERLMNISIGPVFMDKNPGRAFPLQNKWCAVLNFSTIKQQGYIAGIIREPLVSMGMGLILTEDRLSVDADIFEHADILGNILIDKLVKNLKSNPIDNWFDYWNVENLRIFDKLRESEINRIRMGNELLNNK